MQIISKKKHWQLSILFFSVFLLFALVPAEAKTVLDIPGIKSEAKVKVSEGKFLVPYTDFYISAPGFALELTRTYNSHSINYGPFGYGWATNLSTSFLCGPDSSIILFCSNIFLFSFSCFSNSV